MSASPHFAFVSDLADAFNSGAICLPSFPDIVVRIRKTLERDDVCVERVVKVVKTDPALVSKLLVFANSAVYNPSGYPITSVDVAVSRLGFELVKNTAVSLALRQMFLAQKHKALAPKLRSIWQDSVQLSAMCSAVADGRRRFDQDTALVCGLLHYVGKLYILTRAGNYPGFATDEEALASIIDEWHPKVGTSVVESWGFGEAVAKTIDTAEHVSQYASKAPDLVDLVAIAEELLAQVKAAVAAGTDPAGIEPVQALSEHPSMARLELDAADLPLLYLAFQEKLSVVREALTGQ